MIDLDYCDLLIIGAGASGLYLAGLIKAFLPDLKFVIADRNVKAGKKLAVTGNGRCNLTNLSLDPGLYNSDDKDKVLNIIDSHDPEASIAFFEKELGLKTRCKGDLVYPFSLKSKSVIDALTFYCEDNLKLGTNISNLRKDGDIFIASSEEDLISASKVAVCTGGCSYKNTGSDGSFFPVLSSLLGNSSIESLRPVLIPLICSDKDLKELSGFRFECKVSLENNGEIIKTEEGEILFTDYGISGICIMQLSRYIRNGRNNVLIDLSDPETDEVIKDSIKRFSGRTPGKALAGILPEPLTGLILRRINSHSLMKDRDIDLFIDMLHNLRINISSVKEADMAQVTRGGIRLSSLDDHLMTKIDGLYVAGEAANVDGPCGGYNLQWAWSSAYAVFGGIKG